MQFQIDEWVVHSTQGLGQILAIETRTINEIKSLYYMVKVANRTIWVPVDENRFLVNPESAWIKMEFDIPFPPSLIWDYATTPNRMRQPWT